MWDSNLWTLFGHFSIVKKQFSEGTFIENLQELVGETRSLGNFVMPISWYEKASIAKVRGSWQLALKVWIKLIKNKKEMKKPKVELEPGTSSMTTQALIH